MVGTYPMLNLSYGNTVDERSEHPTLSWTSFFAVSAASVLLRKTQGRVGRFESSVLDRLAFIHSKLDEADLSPISFRVYCHVARRAGKSDVCYESVSGMAKFCKLHPDSIWKALKELTAINLIQRENRVGRTTIFRVTKLYDWNPPETKGHPLKPGGTHRKVRGDYPPESKGHEVYPLKEVQEKEVPCSLSSLKVWFLEKTGFPIEDHDSDIRKLLDYWLIRFSIEDADIAVRYLKYRIRNGWREPSALAPRNFFKRFSDTLALANKAGYKTKAKKQEANLEVIKVPAPTLLPPPEEFKAGLAAMRKAL